MDIDPDFKTVENIRWGDQWFLMESEDFISNISFKFKKMKKNSNTQRSKTIPIKNFQFVNQRNLIFFTNECQKTNGETK